MVEFVQKKIQLIMTTGTTNGDVVLIPDTSITYCFKININNRNKSIGFFNVNLSGNTFNIDKEKNIIITGNCLSRLNELKKYTISPDFNNQYVINGSVTVDGVDLTNTNPDSTITYYIGGIKYVDNIVDGEIINTKFIFEPVGYTNDNFVIGETYQNPLMENIVDYPKINNDVFIDRQEISAFDKNFRLEYIDNLSELDTFASGRFFNVVNNV